MSENIRRSERIQNNLKSTLQTTGTASQMHETNKSINKNSNFRELDDFREDLEDVQSITENDKPKVLELYTENDIDGKSIYVLQKNKICQDLQNTSLHSSIKEDNVLIKPCKVLLDKNQSWKIKNTASVEKSTHKSKTSKKNIFLDVEVHDDCTNDETHESCQHSDSNLNNESKIKTKDNQEEIIDAPRMLRSGKPIVPDYHFQTDEYFTIQSEKSVTSNRTLSRLKNPHLDEEKLQELLANNSHIPKALKESMQCLSKTLEKYYPQWFHLMEEGFTVLLYGLGSKRLIINNFYKKMIPDEPTLVINGFFPSLTIKEILDNIIVELLGLETVSNQSDCFDIIEKTMKKHPNDRIYLLIHNLDGGMLRSNKAQDVLSRLANISNVNMLASVDHINAPLIWDNVKRERYNFFWQEATTFLPYEAETSYESSLLVQKNGSLPLLSLQNVFASLTSNAKNIYIILVKYQLANSGNNYSGMAFKDLYEAAREGFLVMSDQALRAQLTEFIDHKLVRTKRYHDGVEYLIIPLDDALLSQFLEQYDVK